MTSRPRGRPPKYPPAEVRARLIDVAIARLHSSGIRGGLDAVILDEAISESEVPRGAAYRMWQADGVSPQDAYRTAVILELLSMPATEGLPATREFALAELERHAEQMASGDPRLVEQVAREMMRTVGEFNFRNLDESVDWHIYTALRTAAHTRPDTPAGVLDVLRRGEEYLIDRYAEFYDEMTVLFGLRLREPYTMQEFSAAIYAANEGLAGRSARTYRRYGIPRPTGPNGEMQDWTLLSVVFEALVDQFFDRP